MHQCTKQVSHPPACPRIKSFNCLCFLAFAFGPCQCLFDQVEETKLKIGRRRTSPMQYSPDHWRKKGRPGPACSTENLLDKFLSKRPECDKAPMSHSGFLHVSWSHCQFDDLRWSVQSATNRNIVSGKGRSGEREKA